MFKKYPASFLLIFIIAGILISDLSRIPVWVFLTLSIIFCVFGLFCIKKSIKWLTPLLFGLSFLSVSAFQYGNQIYDTGINHISNFTDGSTKYHIFGYVSDWPELKLESTEIELSVDSIISNN